MISVDVGQQVFNTTQELILLEAEKAEKLLRRIKDNASQKLRALLFCIRKQCNFYFAGEGLSCLIPFLK